MKQSKNTIVFVVIGALFCSALQADMWQRFPFYEIIVKLLQSKNVAASTATGTNTREQTNQGAQYFSEDYLYDVYGFFIRNLFDDMLPGNDRFGGRVSTIIKTLVKSLERQGFSEAQKEAFDLKLEGIKDLPFSEQIQKITMLIMPYLNNSEKHQLCFEVNELSRRYSLKIPMYHTAFSGENVLKIEWFDTEEIIVSFISGKRVRLDRRDEKAIYILVAAFQNDLDKITKALNCAQCIKEDVFDN